MAEVRRYFGLHQRELAQYLGVSPELVKHIEAGRRPFTSRVLLRLNPLALHLPATPEPEYLAPAIEPLTAAPDVAPLEARLDECLHYATRLRRELRQLAAPTRHAQRWQRVLPALLSAAPGAGPLADVAYEAHTRRWLLVRQERAAEDLDGAVAARYHLLRLRAEALEIEAAALVKLLPQVPDWAKARLTQLGLTRE